MLTFILAMSNLRYSTIQNRWGNEGNHATRCAIVGRYSNEEHCVVLLFAESCVRSRRSDLQPLDTDHREEGTHGSYRPLAI